MTHEPLWTVAGITGAVAAIIALIVAFGITVTEAQTQAILGVAAIVAPLIVAYVTRSHVTPTGDPKTDAGERLVPASSDVSRVLKV